MAKIVAPKLAMQAKSMPVLLAILGSPSAGNEKFAAILQNSVLPKPGGVRIWNNGDPVPWLGLLGYGLKSFSGLEVRQGDPIRTHIRYTTAMLGSMCVNYQFPEISDQYAEIPKILRFQGFAEVP